MSDSTLVKGKGGRRFRERARGIVAGAVLAGSLLGGVSALGDDPVGASQAAVARPAAPAQAAACHEATNWDHVSANRATSFLIFAWARGSNNYLGLIWTTTSLREGPTGTWTMVPECGPTGADGAAVYAQNCAGCHGPQGEGSANAPRLQGVSAHGAEYVTNIVTNGRGGMPAWAGRLTAEEIAAVVNYVMAFPGEHGHDPHHHGGHDTTTTMGNTTTTAGNTTTTAGNTTTTHGHHDH